MIKIAPSTFKRVLVAHQLADELGAAGLQAGDYGVDVVDEKGEVADARMFEGAWGSPVSGGAGIGLQPGAPDREEADGDERAQPVQGEVDGEQAWEAGEDGAGQSWDEGELEDGCREGGADHPGAGAGEPAPVDEEVVGEGEAEGQGEDGDGDQLQEGGAPEDRGVHPADASYWTTILPRMVGWILQW